MSGWICRWKPFWIPVGDTLKKAHIEDWLYVQLQHPPWDSVEAPLPPPSPWDRANVTHPLPSGVELERLDLPFSTSDILSGYEDDVRVRNDSFTL